jgi:non-homologous end joining protein Ku
MATSVLSESPRACETYAAPASRASWCGQLKLGTLCVPVKAYAAIATPPEIPLRQLHAVCGQRIEYRKCCPLSLVIISYSLPVKDLRRLLS